MNGQPEQVPPSGKPRRWRVLLFTLAGLLVLYAAYRIALRVSINSRLDAIRSAGFPATSAELDKWYVQPPAGQNAADIYTEAFAHYEMWTNSLPRESSALTNLTGRSRHSWRPRSRSDLLPIVGLADLPPRIEPLPADMRQLVAEYLSDNAEALRLLHQAASMKSCRYPIDLSQGCDTLLPHLNKLRQAVRLLELEAILNADERKPQQAVESLMIALGVSRSLKEEPRFISYLVGIACRGMAVAGIEPVLNRTALADADLARLASGLGEAETDQALTRAVVGERCCVLHEFQGMRTGWTLDVGFDDTHTQYVPAGLYVTTGLLDLDERNYLDVMERFLKASQLSPPESLAASRSISNMVANLPRLCVLSRMTLGSLGRVLFRAARNDAILRDAQTALAIERYRLANGGLPDQLSDLVPTFLPAVLTDPFDGQPLRYKKLAKGYIVYSIGEDGADNGGAEKNSKGLSYGEGTDITFTVER